MTADCGNQHEDDFYKGTEINSPNSLGWASDQYNLHGGAPLVIYDAVTNNEPVEDVDDDDSGTAVAYTIDGPLDIAGSLTIAT